MISLPMTPSFSQFVLLLRYSPAGQNVGTKVWLLLAGMETVDPDCAICAGDDPGWGDPGLWQDSEPVPGEPSRGREPWCEDEV